MPQRDLLLPWRSALDNATLPLELAGMPRAKARQRVAPAVRAASASTGFGPARPQELSGGMRQRVAFLRTLLAGKPVLLLDEPFGSLDSITRADMQEWLAGALDDQPRTVVLVTHDVEEALYPLRSRRGALRRGRERCGPSCPGRAPIARGRGARRSPLTASPRSGSERWRRWHEHRCCRCCCWPR